MNFNEPITRDQLRKQLRAYLLETRQTHADLAQELDLSLYTVNKLMEGKRGPGKKVRAALGIALAEPRYRWKTAPLGVPLSEAQLREQVRAYWKASGTTLAAFARPVGISANYLGEFLNEKSAIGTRFCQAFGIQKEITYRWEETA